MWGWLFSGRLNLNTAGAGGKVVVCCGRLFLCFGESFQDICRVDFSFVNYIMLHALPNNCHINNML